MSGTFWRAGDLEPGVGLRAVPTGLTPGAGTAVARLVDPHRPDVDAFVATVATWRSPVVEEAPFTSLVPCWGAQAPAGSWVAVEARLRAAGRWSGWHRVAVWSEGEPPASPSRTSVPGPADDVAAADTDVVRAVGEPADAWQVQVLLARSDGAPSPVLEMAGGAVGRALPLPTAASTPTVRGVEVDAPTYSQRDHVGRHPQWDGGGASWCSATSLAMALDALGAGPAAADLAWVDDGPRPQVVHAVRAVYDHAYGGAGNWAFNSAHAWRRGLDARVARVRDLTDLEPHLARGCPVVVSTRFTRDELPGAGYDTAGHLMLLVGVDDDGDPVLHDPNSHELPDESQVRVVYPRLAFERAMARAGGAVYLLGRR